MTVRGKFITVEGIDSAGKDTQLRVISERLQKRGIAHITTREPGGTPLGELIRETVLEAAKLGADPATEALLMFASRREHVKRVIQPALEKGEWVVCSRFTDSTLAYQGAGRGVEETAIAEIAGIVHPGLQPDLTLIIDISVETSAARRDVSQKRRRKASERRQLGLFEDGFEQESKLFFSRVREAYLHIAKQSPQRCRVIDGEQKVEEVSEKIAAAIDALADPRE